MTADLNIYNAEGKKILNTEDFLSTKNAVNEKTTYTCIRILTAGTYYIDCDPWNYGKYNCSFFATCEPAISLARPEITSIKNSAKKAMTIKVATVNSGADLGIIFDTDVDRAGAVLPDGKTLTRNDLIAALSVIALNNCVFPPAHFKTGDILVLSIFFLLIHIMLFYQ